jgi:hypothetical protein
VLDQPDVGESSQATRGRPTPASGLVRICPSLVGDQVRVPTGYGRQGTGHSGRRRRRPARAAAGQLQPHLVRTEVGGPDGERVQALTLALAEARSQALLTDQNSREVFHDLCRDQLGRFIPALQAVAEASDADPDERRWAALTLAHMGIAAGPAVLQAMAADPDQAGLDRLRDALMLVQIDEALGIVSLRTLASDPAADVAVRPLEHQSSRPAPHVLPLARRAEPCRPRRHRLPSRPTRPGRGGRQRDRRRSGATTPRYDGLMRARQSMHVGKVCPAPNSIRCVDMRFCGDVDLGATRTILAWC